jgi:hypothetical protein
MAACMRGVAPLSRNILLAAYSLRWRTAITLRLTVPVICFVGSTRQAVSWASADFDAIDLLLDPGGAPGCLSGHRP